MITQYTNNKHNVQELNRVLHHSFIAPNAISYVMRGGIIHPKHANVMSGSQLQNEDKLEHKDLDVAFLGKMQENWGFFFVESLSCLWYWIGKDIKNITFAFPTEREGNNYWGGHTARMLELLGLFGIKKEQLLPVRKATRFRSVMVAEPSFKHEEVPTHGKKTPYAYTELVGDNDNFYYTAQYRTIYDQIVENCHLDSPTYDKIYLSRTKLKQNKEVGEWYFEEYYRKAGYTIIYPETLSITEQVWLMKNCKELVSIEGTLAHNSLFTEHCEKQIILRKQSEIIPRQCMINQAKGIATEYLNTYYEPYAGIPISHSKGPFWVRVPEGQEGRTLVDWIRYTVKAVRAKVEYVIKRLRKNDTKSNK